MTCVYANAFCFKQAPTPAHLSAVYASNMVAFLQYLNTKISNGEWPQVKDLTIVGDDMTRWRFKLCNFDNDMEGGRNLNDDLNVCPLQHCTHHAHNPFPLLAMCIAETARHDSNPGLQISYLYQAWLVQPETFMKCGGCLRAPACLPACHICMCSSAIRGPRMDQPLSLQLVLYQPTRVLPVLQPFHLNFL